MMTGIRTGGPTGTLTGERNVGSSGVVLGCIAVLALASGSGAQEPVDTVRLKQVVVTATRLPVQLSDAPGSVTVLSSERLVAAGIRNVADAMRLVPGVAVAQSGGPGGITSLFMRGGESDYVQVLVDGVQMNLPGGSFNWAHLRTEDIERIEIVRGPVSVLYGSDAVAGVVQVFTRSGGARRATLSVSGMHGDRPLGAPGNYDSHAFDGGVSGSAQLGAQRMDYGFSAVRAGSTGLYESNSDYTNTQLSGRARITGSNADAGFTLRGSDNEYHYPTSGSGAINDLNQHATGDTRSVGIDGGFRVASALELRILGTLHDYDSRTDDPADNAADGSFWSTANSLRRSVEARANALLSRGFTATAGIEREWQQEQSAYESVSTFGAFTDETDNTRANTGVFAQLHGAVSRALTMTVGGRIDDNQRFGNFTTGRAALTWKPSGNARIHAAVGTAFKEPTFFENYAVGFTRGNPDLEPEESRSWEAGGEVSTASGVTFGATWFDQRFRNMIQYTAAPASDAPNYSNIGRASARGMELQTSGIVSIVTIAGHYTFTRTRTLDSGFGEDPAFEADAALLRRPEHQAAVTATLHRSAFLVTAGARYTGEREDLDFTDPVVYSGKRVTLPSYVTVDAGMGYSAWRYGASTIDVTLHMRNLFNEGYAEIYNFPAAGRVIELGVRAAIDM